MRRSSGWSLLSVLILITAAAVFVYAAYNLCSIGLEYYRGDREYSQLENMFTGKPDPAPHRAGTEAGETDLAECMAEGRITETYVEGYIEDAEPPMHVDWDGLRTSNPDIAGWVYLDAFPGNSYPVMRAQDNEFYLHRDFNKEYLYAGCIFLDCENSMDFSDPASIIYGHNMKNGSMFACLKKLKDQVTCDKNPHFWILTPGGNYRYRIYSVFETTPVSDVYTLWQNDGKSFMKWEETLKERSVVNTDVILTGHDHTVILSTCTPDHEHRTVVIGRCCSRKQPPGKKPEATGSGIME